MWQSWLALHLYVLAVLILGPDSKHIGEAFQPEFAQPLMNLTVPMGRDATFKCFVQNLGGYRVGWVKADTKAIQAIHVHVITNNHRIGVSHSGQTVWNLHIRNVQEEDRGQYMCQINTDPMKSQMGHLDVVVPPDFIPEETSGDVMVPEGGTARVSCRAWGTPPPRVMWKREDGQEIVIRDASGAKTKVTLYEHEVLTFSKISRSEMGAYLCIASNGVPPAVSKRVTVRVHFHPVIQVPNQLVGAPLGTDVTLECYVESSPKSINYWVRDSNEMVISSNKYEVVDVAVSLFENRMSLTVRGLSGGDLGGYRCVAKNSLGEADSVIRLYEIPGPTARDTIAIAKKEELKYSTALEGPDSQVGSGDRADDEDDKDSIAETAEKNHAHETLNDNTTKNRTHYNLLQSFKRNKVNKIMNVVDQKAQHNDGMYNSVCEPVVITVYFLYITDLLI